MLVKIQVGIGSPGKLWTGSMDFFSIEGQRLVECELVENWSESGATTRRLFFTSARELSPGLESAIEIPVVHIATGGVGSIPAGNIQYMNDDIRKDVAVWNWSGRVGGFIIVDPILVLSGYYHWNGLPATKPGHAWVETYSGSTLSEYVLVQLDKNGWIHPRHRPPVTRWHQSTLSPPEKEVEAASEPEAAIEVEPAE